MVELGEVEREGQAARDTLGTAPVVTEARVFPNTVVCSFRFSFMFQHPPPHSLHYLCVCDTAWGPVGTEHLEISHSGTLSLQESASRIVTAVRCVGGLFVSFGHTREVARQFV